MSSKVYLGLDGIQSRSRGHNFGTVGYICELGPYSTHNRVEVLQDMNGYAVTNWCASNWTTIPHDELWTVCRQNEWFVSQVQYANLDFRGTPFEHRYNNVVIDRQILCFMQSNRSWLTPLEKLERGLTPLEEYEQMLLDCQLLLSTLADQERNVWGRRFATFIPFKSPNPQGYQGVWGDFDVPFTSLSCNTYVLHEFDSGRHILKTSRID